MRESRESHGGNFLTLPPRIRLGIVDGAGVGKAGVSAVSVPAPHDGKSRRDEAVVKMQQATRTNAMNRSEIMAKF